MSVEKTKKCAVFPVRLYRPPKALQLVNGSMRRPEERCRIARVSACGHDPRAVGLASEDVAHHRLRGLAIRVEDARRDTSRGEHTAAGECVQRTIGTECNAQLQGTGTYPTHDAS